MRKLLALLFLIPSIVQAQKDTTIKVEIHVTTGRDTVKSVIHDTVTVKSKPDTVTISKPSIRDTVYWSPQTNANRDSVLWFGPYPYNGGLGKPANFKLPLGPGSATVTIYDTIKVTVHDTVKITLPPIPCTCNQIPNPPGLHISDLPSRVGEMNVYNDSTYLGRLMYQDNQPGKIWFAFQYKQGEMAMTQLPLAYGDSLSAMAYLLHPDNPPANPVTLNPHVPQLPGAVLKPN